MHHKAYDLCYFFIIMKFVFFSLFFCSSFCFANLTQEFSKNNLESMQLIRHSQALNAMQNARRLPFSVTVAVIDSGASLLHPLLLNHWLSNPFEVLGNNLDDDNNGLIDDNYGYDYVNQRAFMVDDNGHGTHVSGIIAGINPNVKIIPIKVLASNGDGSLTHVLSAIEYAVKRGAQVLNLSLGVMDTLGTSKAHYEQVINFARKQNVLVVAAAGNNTSNNDEVAFYPSNIWQDNLLSICATDHKASLASFSNYGQWKVHLCAPGVNILSTGNNFLQMPWVYQSGTSQAAPIISGAASLVLSINPLLKPYQVRNILMETATIYPHLKGTSQTGGVVNLEAAINKVLQ